MKIVLVDEVDGQRKNERTFEQATITIGRDASQCHIVFDQSHSVSRRHAELRWRDGRWLLVDTNSSFGTFVDGQKIAAPADVHRGARLRFGDGGPTVVVLALDEAAPPSSAPAVAVELIDGPTGRLERFPVNKPIVTIGRDPANDISLDATAVAVSRQHAEIREEGGRYVLHDRESFNGTFVNDQSVAAPTPLYDNDRIQLGRSGPILRFAAPVHPAPKGAAIANERGLASGPSTAEHAVMATLVVRGGAPGAPQQIPPAPDDQLQLLMRMALGGRAELSIGRAPSSDIHLDGLQISKNHARLLEVGGGVSIEDAGSTNGVHVNGTRISQRTRLTPSDIAQIGPFVFKVEPGPMVMIFDTRSKTRIDAIGLTKAVGNRSGEGTIVLLDDVGLTIHPNEFVGLLGPSGAGKSTLMDALNGMRRATSGQVLINDLDLYQHLDVLKQSIGYVPQDDIIHRELTVYRTLYYVARLRLAADITADEIGQIINEVMDVTGLSERRDVPVAQLSGGQRKRVSIAVELITKPSVIFLDEPTSGLDPATEDRIMRLFRQIAESGRTVVLTTHAMENVSLFDRIVVLMRGKLVFYGAPHDALRHLKAETFKDLYDKLEAPIEAKVATLGPLAPGSPKAIEARYNARREAIADEVAEEWKQKFMRTEQYRENVAEPAKGTDRGARAEPPARPRQRLYGALRQGITLSGRYAECLKRDRFTLMILLAQAPLISLLTLIVTVAKQPRDFPYFILAVVAIWFGTSVAAREIIRERGVYERERMVNLALFPYVGSKLLNLSMIVGVQCVLLFGTLKFVDVANTLTGGAIGFSMPGVALGIPQLLVMITTGMVGVAIGLLISAVVRTSEMATSLVPLVLIPQIVFSGLVGMPTGVARVVGLAMPATWAFDEMKQLSGLGVLRDAGDGGLYKDVERLNGRNVAVARERIDRFRRQTSRDMQSYEAGMSAYMRRPPPGDPTAAMPKAPSMAGLPSVPDPVRVPDDLSKYVDFRHPWMNAYVSPVVLVSMFVGLTLATVMALRAQDVK